MGEQSMAERDYVALQRLFENVILMESRPILRWFLFVVDRAGCFGERCIVQGKDMGDITVFLKSLEQYVRAIHAVLNAEKVRLVEEEEEKEKRVKLLSRHQLYLLKMCVDVDEVRARGVSSLQYWLRQGTLACNPDL